MNRVCARAREMLKPFGKKTNTAKRVLRVLTVPLAACALLFGATSASADQTVLFSNHTVKTVNPTGTTVNLFDYWVVNGDNDKSVNINNNNGNNNTGINKNHQLKFNGGAGAGINKWTGRSNINGFGRLSFVKPMLVKGYPAINNGTYTSQGQGVNYTDESLAYLFNNDSQANGKQDGKAVYSNVKGLFQLKDGYYVYDSYGSNGNYAVYNPTTNSFNVYDKAGVYKSKVSDTNLGQFFPFDSADKVFEESGNKLSPKGITDGTNSTLNHHFGMSMTTEFVQPNGGQTTKNEDMVFEFSGDDDVWVYIDGVLVGDLGGIHEKATLKINFATGGVHVGHVDNANDPEKTIQDTTIRAMFEAAGADTTNFRENTFQNSTKHTLSFFYLERGAGASNMSLKFNLTTLPSSEVAKVDQNGEAVQGAKFALYQSDESWTVQDGAEAIAQGATDDKGQLVLLKKDRSVLSFDSQHADGHDYFVLKETNLPEGYRSSLTSSTTATPGELHLKYKQAAASGSGGVVVAPQTTVTTADGKSWTGSRMWLNGGYLAAKETISLDKDTQDNKGNAISSGTTFAVVLKLTGASEDHTSEDAWTAVTGNPLNGYKLCSAHGIAGAVEAAKSADTSVFDVNTKGDYVVTVRSLPGDIEKYAAMMTDKSKAEYTVAVYHTTASSLAGATIDNTSMVQYQTINRQFSTVIHLTNVQNRLFVQKVNDLGKPVNDATFQLYQAKDVTGNSPSTYAIKPGAEPYDTVKANDATYPYEIKGTACFPLDSVNHKPLTKGTYYLRESVSPDGYEINNTITKVIVDDSGVYVDAGEKGDGVLSVSGPGSLIASLAQFGSPDSIDNTLTYIKGKLQSAVVDADGNLTWGQKSTAEGVTPSLENDLMHMRYDKTAQGTKTVLRYVEDGGGRNGKLATIFADTGINRMALYQDDDATNGTDLGTLRLNHLFTTATGVQYADRRVARLQVTKTVTADSGLTAPTKDANGNDLTFTFKFTLPDSEEGYEARVFDANGKSVGNSFTLKNGDTHSIKAGETIRVYDLKKGDSYSVSELTTKGEESSGNVLASIVNTVTGSADESVLPAGFSLVSRKAGGEEQSGTGNTITGKIVALEDGKIPASNKLEFTNKYRVNPVKNGLSAKKVLEGRNWADGDSFTVQLTADDGVLMPGGAKSKVATVELTNDQPATFGDITYTKPGTCTHTIKEVIPGSNARADGISYSAASYTATVVVEDNHAGALVVKSVKMVQECNDAGVDTKTDVADKIATFTNRYDTHEHSIIIHAQKNLVDNAGTFPLARNAFTFTLEGVGGYADANAVLSLDTVDKNMAAPMPQGTEGNTATVGNNADDGAVTWPAISYTAKADAGRAYVYKFAENRGSVTGMTYDGSVYYAVVRNAKKGAGIQTSIEYYKIAEDGSVKQLDTNVTPSFTNIYSVDPTSVTLQGQKTVSGRDWNQGESYAFNLTAAADDANATGLSKTTAQAVKDGVVAVNANKAVASAPESGRVASFSFGTEAAPTVTFNRAGTFTFNITENAAQDGQAGMSTDKHTARATVVVTDLDESGNHTGKLRVSSVTYANTGASDADKAVTDKAAFTNAYHASGTFDGVTVSKTLEGRASAAGQFTFSVTGLWYNGVQTSVDGSEASLSNKVAGAGVSGAVVSASGEEKLFARDLTERDLGRTFVYRIHENQPAAAGYTYDTGYTGDAIVLVKITEDAVKDAQSAVDTINNTATVTVGNKSYTGTTTNYVPKKSESDTQDSNESGVALGDELTYAIGYKNTEGASATVTITDAVPAGTEFVEFAGDHKDAGSKDNDGKLTWTLADVPAGKEGAVQFKVRVTEDAFKSGGASGDISNQASVAVGNNPAVKTNTTTDQVSDGRLTLSKTVTAAEGITAPNKAFTFQVLLYQADGTTPLAGTFAYAGRPGGTNGTYVSGQIKSGDTIALKAGGSVTVTLPTGAHYEVQELDSNGELMTSEDGFAVVDKANPQKGTIGQATQVGFTNVYSVESTKVENAFKVQKKISGRNWTKTDAFTMTLTAQGEAPMPKGAKEGVSTIELHKDAQVGNFGAIEYTKPGAYTYMITEQSGDEAALTFSKATYRATVTVTDDGAGKLSAKTKIAQLTDDAGDAAGRTVEAAVFTNTYGTVTEGRDVSTAGLFTKTLEGRDWAEGDSFQFALTGEDGAPMPEGSADGSKTVSVTAAGTKAGDRVAFDFGSIRYTLDDIKDAEFAEVGGKRVRAKTFTYTVREVRPDDGSAIAGVAYDGHVAMMTVTVIDDGSGNLTATTPAIAEVSGGDFVNTYTTELDYSARAGVRLSKTLSGRAMEAGQFAFTVTADAETAAKLSLKTGKDAYAVAAADDGKADLVDLIGGAAESDVKFTDADAGKTYSFTVTETKLGGEAYTNDTAPRTVTIAPGYDAATGKLTVTTTVAKDGVEVARGEVSTADDATAAPAPVTVAFENSYEATGTLGGEGNVAINATKTLTGRAAAAGEFSFSVRNAQGDVVATASNQASGDGEAAGLAFSPIAYTTDALGRMVAGGIATRAADGSWVIPYTVSEDGTDRLPAGVTATASSFDITVKVTDNGKGGLDTAVVYPEGSDGTLSFVNGYSADEATVDLAGTKTLALSQAGLGLAQADIAGKYTFKIEPLDGAPAPVDASGKTVTEATNDAAGNVELGHITFKQPSDLDDAEIDGDGLRTKTFAYRVSESGSVDGVVNDATAARTFTVKVVEDTNAGTLAAEVLPAEGTLEGKGAFEFTNTYVVNPTPSSVTDQIKVSKKLKGRDLAEGEFEFQLVEIAADGSESVAATGKNAADGTVALSPVTYTAPGTHSYELREVAGTAGGVTYDRATYRVCTTVTDAGDGMLAVKHELADAEGNPASDDSVTFTNGYEAAPVTLKLGAAKVLKGAELKAGQFSFELKSRDGKVMSTAKNAADGSVTFDALTFKQAGTYTFTVSEIDDGQAHVTYDKAVHKIVVTVSDEATDGTKTGYLSAKVSYEGDANVPPVFTNSYAEEPGTPGTPENPGTPGGGSGGGSDNGSGGGSSGDGSKGGMPDTGDRSLPVEALAVMAGIGALTAVGGAVLYRRRR